MPEHIRGRLIDRIGSSDIVPHLHGKKAREASEDAARLFDMCIDNPSFDGKGYPFNPQKIRENFDKGNLDATSDYNHLLEFAARRHGSTKEAILSIRKQECDWIIGEQ